MYEPLAIFADPTEPPDLDEAEPQLKTYGSLTHLPGSPAQWSVKAEPQVMIRLKRLFPRARPTRAGEITMADTPEVARDLEWVLSRWPLTTSIETAAMLSHRASEHRETEATLLRILKGQHTPLGQDLRRPARPARDYQQVAADIVLATGRLLLTDQIGLGKSMSGLLVLAAPDALPALVVSMSHLLGQWVDELAFTWPDLVGHIATKATPYDPSERRGADGRTPEVLILSYSKLAGWSDHLAGQVNTVIFDETQELRTGTATAKGAAAAHVASEARYVVGLTASPVYNYGGEVHNIIDIISPGSLGTRDEFAREWGLGNDRKMKVRNPAALGSYLRDQGLMLGRSRKDVGRELSTTPLRVTHAVNADERALDQLTGDAIEMAKLILSDTADARSRWRAAGDFDLLIRQATGIAKAPYVAEFVRVLLESEEKVVLWGWHRAVYEIWAQRLDEFQPVAYTGSETTGQKIRSAEAFTSGASRVLLMSLRAGAGLNGLQHCCHVGVFGELDWSPQVHNQCIGRLDRDGQSEPVTAYFLVSHAGADPVMAEVLELKHQQAEPIVHPDATLFEPLTDTSDKVKRLAADVLARHGIRADGLPL